MNDVYVREVDGTRIVRPVEKKAAESVGALLQAKIRADCWHEHSGAIRGSISIRLSDVTR